MTRSLIWLFVPLLVVLAACTGRVQVRTGGERLPEPPCTGDQLDECLEPQASLQSISSDTCDGAGRPICLVPLGQVDPGLVQRLVDYYHETYGLTITVLTPGPLPRDFVEPSRYQIDTATLIAHMGTLFPSEYSNPSVVLIGITPVDLYDKEFHYRYLFGAKGTLEDPKAVLSSARMDPVTYHAEPNDDVTFARARKLLSKYLGLLYYGLPPSDDPSSPMFDSILGPDDLDRMEEPLPLSATR